jgi:SAM-dependent MidA family methyltransferase
VAEAVPWRQAMTDGLYGPDGFFTRVVQPGGSGAHFRTSAHASGLFATALLRVVLAADEALGRPHPFDLVDVGAGGGHLLRHLVQLVPTHLARRMRTSAVELAPRPVDLPDGIRWRDRLPRPGSITGVLLATEWLDNVPLDVAEVDRHGQLRYVLVDPSSGAETPGGELSPSDAAWAEQWWAADPWNEGVRVELGGPRDEAWSAAVASLSRGVALTVDYGHMWRERPGSGTLTGFYAGRGASTIPNGSRDITAHVAIDAACAAGEAVAQQPAVLTTQRQALEALGLSGARPPLALASTDPAEYVRALSAASQAAELMDPDGLGGHYWVVQPVGVAAEALPPLIEALFV